MCIGGPWWRLNTKYEMRVRLEGAQGSGWRGIRVRSAITALVMSVVVEKKLG